MDLNTYIQYWTDTSLQHTAIQPVINHATLWPDRQEYDKEFIAAKKALGNVNFTKHPTLPLGLYCYNKTAFYSRMTVNEAFTRGVLVELGTGRLIAWPMGRMMNWMDNEDVPSNVEVLGAFEKFDGSLIIASLYNNRVVFTTKGGFNGVWVDEAYKWLNKLSNDDREEFVTHLQTHTAMFEAIIPRHNLPNRSYYPVVDYGNASYMQYLMSRNTDIDSLLFGDLGVVTNTAFPALRPNHSDIRLYQMRDRRDQFENLEGWVAWVKHPYGIYPLKIKTKWYLEQSRSGVVLSVKKFVKYVSETGKLLPDYFSENGVNDPEQHLLYDDLREAEEAIADEYTALWMLKVHLDISSIPIAELSDYLYENYSHNKKKFSPIFKYVRVGDGGSETFWWQAAAHSVAIDRGY